MPDPVPDPKNGATGGGWDWFDGGDSGAGKKELALAAARCFRGADGERLLAHLRRMTVGRALGPGASDTVLRHLEGQRQLVAYLAALIDRGRDGG